MLEEEEGVDPQVTAEDLLNEIEEGAKVYSELTANFMDSFEFYGKTLMEWGSEMTINIPENLDQVSLRKLLTELGNKIQVANNYYSLAISLSKAFGSGNEIKKADLVNSLVSYFDKNNKKRPAATVIERMADSYMKNTVSTRAAAAIVRDFWKQRLEMLSDIRRILEQISMSLAVEYKWIGSQ